MSEVSVYIPCFNATETIQSCLEAVLRQTYLIKEILVIDDGSTDETTKIVSGYSVRLIRHMNNQGLAAARNTALKNINTEFVASLDADCIPEPNWLERLMKRFNSAKIVGVGGKVSETYVSSPFDLWRSVHMKQYWEEEAKPVFLFGSNTVFRKKTIVEVGLYDKNFKNNYEDVDISHRLKKLGYTLVYEPKAIVHHLRSDDIRSILNIHWNWNLDYYKQKGFYSNSKSLILKLKDNIGTANRYIEEDFASKRYQILFLDFLLALHHSLRDFEYFFFRNNQEDLDTLNSHLLYHWLALLDLTFFYHFNSGKNNLSTFVPKSPPFLQNFFALNLILGRHIQEKFRNKDFQKILYKHLLLSVYKIHDTCLLDKLSNLVELHQDWSGLLKKKQPNLTVSFLKNLSLNFQKWLEVPMFRFPEVIHMIEISAEKTDRLSL